MTIKLSSEDKMDWTATGIEQIKNNVLNIIRTRRGEVPYMPTLGLNPDYIDSPLLQNKASLEMEIRNQLALFEPNVALDSLNIIPSEDGDYIVEVVISL
mgnify:FL=1